MMWKSASFVLGAAKAAAGRSIASRSAGSKPGSKLIEPNFLKIMG
jgi:hypothetical protein